jgi:3-methyladenine DNA glycosylase/8-oxoguanine DNA glycosylase
VAVVRTTLRPRGPYELRLVARGAGDASRRFADGVFRAVFRAGGLPAHARVWQRPDRALEVVVEAAEPEAAVEHLRFVLAVDDDHTDFLRRFARDPLIGAATRRLAGLRPLRTSTVTHALLRALAGQLVAAHEARATESRVVRLVSREHEGLHLPPERTDLASLAPAVLCGQGLAARKAAALVRMSRGWDVERLRAVPTHAAVRRLLGERGLGPWSAGVISLQGLGRVEHGLVGDLGLIKLCTARTGREATAEDTAALLARYGEWQGLASLYLMASAHVAQAELEVRRLRAERRRRSPRGAREERLSSPSSAVG